MKTIAIQSDQDRRVLEAIAREHGIDPRPLTDEELARVIRALDEGHA